jgi:hypothetical protein
MNKTLLANVALLFASLLVVFVILEVAVRFTQAGQDYVPSDCCSFVLRPSTSFCYSTKEFSNCFKTNNEGYLSGPFECPAGKQIIAVLGDSFTEAKQVAQDKSYTALLQTMGDWCVYNYGISAYGTGHELQTYRAKVVPQNPNIVVLQFQPQNDITDNLRVTDYINGTLQLKHDNQFKPRNPYALQLPSFIRSRVGLLLARMGFLNQSGFEKAPLDNYMVYTLPQGKWVDAWDREEILLGMFKNETASRGERLIILIATAPEQVNPAYRKALFDVYPGLANTSFVFHEPNQQMLRICDKLGIECIDMLGFNRSDTHFFYDGHWNEKGHQLAATVLAQRIEQGPVSQ